MEVEARWKWKVDGSGSAIVTAPNGPNEPPYATFCNDGSRTVNTTSACAYSSCCALRGHRHRMRLLMVGVVRVN